MYNRAGEPLGDIFDTIQQAGQGVIDAGAAAVGIEKGGTIDNIVTGAANAGRDIGIIPDAKGAVSTGIDIITGGGGSNPSGAPRTGSVGSAMQQPTSSTSEPSGTTDMLINTGVGAGVGGATYMLTKSIWAGLAAGLGGTLLTRHLRKRGSIVGR